MTKYALIYVNMLKHDFPLHWQTAFQQLISLIPQSPPSQQALLTSIISPV